MRSVEFKIPAGMSINDAAERLIRIARDESTITCDPEILALGIHNGIVISAKPTSTVADIVRDWADESHKRAVQDERIRPVREAIRYLLGTLSTSDRGKLIREIPSMIFVTVDMSKEGA